MRDMCHVKLVDNKMTNGLMQILDLEETMYQLAKASSVRWYGHVLRKEQGTRF